MEEGHERDSPLKRRLDEILPGLTQSEARIARTLLSAEATAMLETGASLAKKAEVSEITVSRFLRRLGFRGMKGLREALRDEGVSKALSVDDRRERLLAGTLGGAIRREAEAVLALGEEIARAEWETSLDAIEEASEVYVTGFQMVRGLAEDFARRLSLIRGGVRFLAAHDGGLVEWASLDDRPRTLIIIDTLPYAREAAVIARTARDAGMKIVFLTDEPNNAAYEYTNLVFHCRARNGLFIESVGGLGTLMALFVHALAERCPQAAAQRLANWEASTDALGLFQ